MSTFCADIKHKTSLAHPVLAWQLQRMGIGRRIAEARKAARVSQIKLGELVGAGQTTISSWERGRTEPTREDVQRVASALGLPVSHLEVGEDPAPGERPALVPILGIVGARAGDEIIMTTAQAANDFAPIPPGGTTESVALEVSGHSMRGYADDGALIYFEIQRTPPSSDMLGQIVVAETVGGQVLLKRLLRGSAPDLYDLESFNDAPMRDVRLVWAAEPTAIIPPKHARKIIRRGGVDV